MVEAFTELARVLQTQCRDRAQQVTLDHWVFEVMTGDERSQIVHLLYKAADAEGRDVSRVVADSPIGPLPERLDLKQLLRKNAELDVGAICIEDFQNEDNELVTYLTLRSSHLLSTASSDACWEIIEKVARVADALERELYADDLY